jgi:monofunctional glycosyltransferase
MDVHSGCAACRADGIRGLAGKKQRSMAAIRGRLLRWSAVVSALLVLTSVLQVLLLRWVPPLFTAPMGFSWVKGVFVDQARPTIHYRWVPLHDISPHLRRAVMAGEDQRFLDHNGFDLIEIRKALGEIASGERLRGASTISMQTARGVFLVPSRSIWRKALEAYYTVLLEALWSKQRILEMYLNTVDWGDGIYGAEAAARIYFQSSAADLSRPRAALLTAILPNPHRFSPLRPSAFVRQRQRQILSDLPHMPLVR